MALSTALRSEFATLQKSFLSFMGFYGGTGFILQNPDRTLREKGNGEGLRLYDRVLEDAHAHAVFQQRSLELISRDWEVTPASDSRADRKAADLVERQLMALGIRDYPLARIYGHHGLDGVALHFLEAIPKGYAVGEVMWATDTTEVFAAEIRHRDQRRFGWIMGEDNWELRLITDRDGTRGEPIPDRKIIYHAPTATDGTPYGLGLCSKVFWPVFFKKQNIQFWLIFADKFGSPTPVGKYQPGTSEEDKAVLLEALNNLTQGLATILPEGMLIEFLEATRSGSITSYEALCRYMDEQISEAVLGQTGTTNQSDGGGSRARDEVARTGMVALVRADADLLARTLERTLIRWMVDANRPILGERAQAPSFRWKFDTPEDLTETATRDKLLFDMGWVRTQDSLTETYGEGYEPKSTPEPPPMMATPQSAPEQPDDEPALPTPTEPEDMPADAAFAEPDDDPMQPLTERLATETAPYWRQMIDVLRERLASATSLEQFLADLNRAYPDLPDGDLLQILSQALSASRFAGIYEAQEEAQ